MIGKLLDHRYQVIRVLATGGFGQTYIAEDTRRPGNPTCVVKHLQPATSDPRVFETAKRLFHSEAETLEKLGHHDQIPRLLAYFDENQEFYLVQEFIDGHTLTEELIPGNRWTESQVIHLLQEVLSILEFVHNQGVIHRDIKPDNIIRRTTDNKLVLVDFGAVKQLRTQMVTVGGQSAATVVIGTPGYMATEQGQGKPRANSDIYALGIIAIQALTGISPTELQEDPQTGELIWRHLVNVNERLAAVLNKMVRYHFKDRYQTATEALQGLQNAINPVPVVVSSTSAKSFNHPTYQQAKPSSPVSRQQTVAVAPAHKVVSQPARQDSNKSDPLPLLIGIVLAGGAAALVANLYPNVKNFAANVFSNDDTSDKCLAVVAGNSNIRSEPSSINTDTVLQTVGVNTNYEVTGKRTKRGWVEIKLKSGRLAWAHSDVILNKAQWPACLRDREIAIKTVDDSTLIAARPKPQTKPRSETFINPAPEPDTQPTEQAQPPVDTGKIIAQARQKYDSGDLVGAIAMLRSIPANASAGIKETATMINQWQQDWQKADALFNDINKALEDGQWDKVLEYKNHPEKLPNIKYWRDKLEPVFKEAAENVAKQALPKTEIQEEQNQPQQETPNTEEPSADETPSSQELPQGGY
ncbi:Serine/Threonine protein kinase [Nostoc sp. NIES-3756]|uniref:serine/threonine protein kinase n=1 Tax=Nostoc sp. NIES-3756 TaxID=1751286 RepID=UPI000721D6B9|nr:serine/threonine protein kinase [Nostoc sp. NIES-3756]BAT52083.1 Serine/Threonine protein kinase [Nostoc sp. NIES-3756]BAY40213.1 serine/threonine protein kinase [Nostoc sp. NIES-2111]